MTLRQLSHETSLYDLENSTLFQRTNCDRDLLVAECEDSQLDAGC